MDRDSCFHRYCCNTCIGHTRELAQSVFLRSKGIPDHHRMVQASCSPRVGPRHCAPGPRRSFRRRQATSDHANLRVAQAAGRQAPLCDAVHLSSFSADADCRSIAGRIQSSLLYPQHPLPADALLSGCPLSICRGCRDLEPGADGVCGFVCAHRLHRGGCMGRLDLPMARTRAFPGAELFQSPLPFWSWPRRSRCSTQQGALSWRVSCSGVRPFFSRSLLISPISACG